MNYNQLFALHDVDARGGIIQIQLSEAESFNQQGYGIFHATNDFIGRKKIENVTRINAWAIEMDDGPKEMMIHRIQKGLVPSLVIESKRGYHVYFKARNARLKHFRSIMDEYLVPFYSADKRAKDAARLLRVPGFYHLKDPSQPFLIREVLRREVAYSEEDITSFYKRAKRSRTPPNKSPSTHSIKGWKIVPGSFWDAVTHLDCEYALTHLSGSSHVRGETYEFVPTSEGKKNIYVNGKSSSCWIDKDGRIGSATGGGPTIVQWLEWFGLEREVVKRMIQKEFQECLI